MPYLINEPTKAVFSHYGVLSERELESRFEVWVEQYTTIANIEAETTWSIAKTMLLPAALRYLELARAAGVREVIGEVETGITALISASDALAKANVYPDGVEGMELAEFARDTQLTAMADVRVAADKLERIVADDLWPLPKYSEILFIK